MGVRCHCIIEHPHVVYRPRPSSKDKSKPHVEVTDSQYIMCGHSLPAQVLHKLITRDHTRHMSAIYGPYAILEIGKEPTLPQPWMHGCEGCVNSLNDSAASLTKHFKTLSNNLLTVPIDPSNLSSACLTDCGAPTIHRNMPSDSMEVLLLLDLRP